MEGNAKHAHNVVKWRHTSVDVISDVAEWLRKLNAAIYIKKNKGVYDLIICTVHKKLRYKLIGATTIRKTYTI